MRPALQSSVLPAAIPTLAVEAPAVELGGGRPETATRVRLADFDGPLGLLLALIEARQLDVLTVPLAALADAYLDALSTLEGDRLANVSAFVAVASQLILIKSRAMLPRPPQVAPAGPDEGPDPEAELRARLLLYRAFRDAGGRLQATAGERVGLFRREPAAAASAALAGARPPAAPPLPPTVLAEALGHLIRLAPMPEPPPGVLPRIITLAERAALIRAALRGASSVVLQDLLAGVRDRAVMAVTFLAMLEMVKRREVAVEQAEPWGPIMVRRLDPGPAGEASGSDEPLDEGLEGYA